MNLPDPHRFSIGTIDHGLRFLPESLCALAYTEFYRQWHPPLQLRYNQLFASCYHEHFILLEQLLAGAILPALIQAFATEPIAARLQNFADEERVHTAWFHRLHQASEPQLYRENYHVFVRVPGFARRLLVALARRPKRFPFVLWLAMMIEERTIPAAREILRSADQLEPHYVTLHRLHAADEAGHVGCDGELLARLWPALSPPLRRLNRWLFVSLLREFFQVPKRAGWRVVQQLARERPEVRPQLPPIREAIEQLEGNRTFLRTLYSRAREPRTFALADRFEDLHGIEDELIPQTGSVA